MATNNKDFKVKNGLKVSGPAVFSSDVVLGTTPLAFDSTTNRLKIQVNNEWVSIATLADADVLTFEDIGVSVDYDGSATYIIQANGVEPAGTSKFVDGGDVSTTDVRYIFDSGVLQ
jgi:hypothetical protein